VLHVVDHNEETEGPQLHDRPPGPPCFPREFDDSLARGSASTAATGRLHLESLEARIREKSDSRSSGERGRSGGSWVHQGMRPRNSGADRDRSDTDRTGRGDSFADPPPHDVAGGRAVNGDGPARTESQGQGRRPPAVLPLALVVRRGGTEARATASAAAAASWGASRKGYRGRRLEGTSATPTRPTARRTPSRTRYGGRRPRTEGRRRSAVGAT
ncbi:hypothetical protein THAOC_23445, partial [Thalassiosira oceanica]